MTHAPGPREPRRAWWRPTRATLPSWLFGAFVAVAGPLILFHYGTYHWFHRDEWAFLSESASGGDAWLRYTHEPFGGSHWVAVPRLIYQGLWHTVGMTSYKPYQLLVVVLHLLLAVMVHQVMRRAGVRPWLAFAAAAVLVIDGPGATTTVWAFQMTIVGSMAFGLVHLVLADHDGPVDRRDALGLVFGLLAITFSGVGVTTTVAVVISTLLRRGWRIALLHGGPLGLIYGAWAVLTGARTTAGSGRPSVGVVADWVWESAVGTLVAVGRWNLTAWLLAAVLVIGLALAWADRRSTGDPTAVRRLAAPVGLGLAAVFFATSTAFGRAWAGAHLARSDRYLYIEAALALPLIALGAEAIARRWRQAVAPLAVLLLLPVPFNLTAIESRGAEAGIFGPNYHAKRKYIVTTAVRMPFADAVPPDVQPVPDPFSYGVTIGFLLEAVAEGTLTPPTVPLTPRIVNEFRVRLGVGQSHGPAPSEQCRAHSEPLDIDPEVGEEIHLGSRVVVATRGDDRLTSPGVVFDPVANGSTLTVELPDLHLRIKRYAGAPTFTLCEPPEDVDSPTDGQ